MINQIHTISQSIKNHAYDLGFYHIGIAKAQPMEEEERRLATWLNKGYHGQMGYMANHFEKRVDPTKLVPGAKSVISLAYNYYTTAKQTDVSAPRFSTYAFGKDYHFVVKEKMKRLFEYIQNLIGSEVSGRSFVDSAPVLERDWAKRAGVGWVGKNTLLIHPKKGSFFFLGEIILDLEMVYDAPMKDYCGTCRKCIEACPTEAISPKGYVMDGSKCISYLTIELKEAIPTEFKGKMENWVFGCDICQDVCPWNRFSKMHDEPEFQPKDSLLQMEADEWFELTSETFSQLFSKSAVKRTKFARLKRNIQFIQS